MAETYYKIDVAIEVKESEIKFDTVHVSFQVYHVSILVVSHVLPGKDVSNQVKLLLFASVFSFRAMCLSR